MAGVPGVRGSPVEPPEPGVENVLKISVVTASHSWAVETYLLPRLFPN